jgi:hypothetical protein
MDEEQAAVIEFLGAIILCTVAGIGWLDLKSGLSPFEKYTTAYVDAIRRRSPSTSGRGGEDRPTPPAATT